MRPTVGPLVAMTLILAAVLGARPTAASDRQSEIGDAGFRPLRIAQALVRWQAHTEGHPIVLRYAIADRDLTDPEAINCGSMRAPTGLLSRSHIELATLRLALDEALMRWQSVAGISFEPAASLAVADIVVGEQAKPTGWAYTNVTLAKSWSGPVRPIVAASICLNPEQPWKIGFDGDLGVYDLVHTLTHEIGHAIGLDHPAGRGHVMSFRYDESRASLSGGDALGAVTLYGPRQVVKPAVEDTAADSVAARARPSGGAAELGLR